MKQAKKITFTKDGFEELKKEYTKLLNSRPEALEHLKRARELGDLSENGYYKASRQKLSFLDGRLRELSYLLKNATFAQAAKADIVGIGTLVTIKDGKITQQFHLVGEYEADPAQKKISANSPLGAALMSKKTGDAVRFNTPAGTKTFAILSIKIAS